MGAPSPNRTILLASRPSIEAPPVWRPHPGQQELFMRCNAHEALFGGAAGPGKTEVLLMESLRQIDNPAYRGILFRRISPSLEGSRGLIERSLGWFPAYGGIYNGGRHFWVFPSGARIFFGHMQYEEDRLKFQGTEYSFLGFDELTEFTERQYLYMLSRNRAPVGSGLRVYIRSATNPGGIGHGWVKDRFVTRDILNLPRHFAQIDNRDVEVHASHPDALSRAFFPAIYSENPSLDEAYLRNLRAMTDPIEKARLLTGDWDVQYTHGRFFPDWSLDNIDGEIAYNPDLPLYWALDDGYAYGDGPGHANYHPRVFLFCQDNEIGGLNVIDEYVACGETYGQTLERVLAMPYPKPAVAYCPSEAATFRGELHARDITTVNATHRVVEGIKAVRQLIFDGEMRRLRVHPRCENLIYEVSIYRSDDKARSESGEPVPLKQDDHSMDALRYLTFNRYRAR